MATEPLEYKITFDTSEVAQKLQEVKNQMDTAFGAQAFQNSGPDPYPFQQLFETPRNVIADVSTGFDNARKSFSNARGIFNNVADSARLGYTRFREDMELDGLIARQEYRMTRKRQLGFEDSVSDALSRGWWGSEWQSATGTGYDPSMAINRKEYTYLADYKAKQEFKKPSMTGALLGAAGMATAGGPVGFALGAGELGLEALKAISYPLTANKRKEEAVSSYIHNASWRFLSGRIKTEDSNEIAKYINKIPNLDQRLGDSYKPLEVDKVIDIYTKSGGFDLVRSSEQYKETIKKLFEDHRQVMHTLYATSQEAASLMASLSKDLGVTDFSGWATTMKVTGTHAGLSGREITSFAMQGAEMARGSGFNMKSAATGAAELLADVRDMAKQGIYTDEMIRQGGGVENMALQATRSALNFGSSPIGMVNNAALLSASLAPEGSTKSLANMGINEKLSRAAGLFSSEGSILRFMGMQQELNSAKGPQMLGLEEAQTFMQQYNEITGNYTNVDPYAFKGFLLASGSSKTEADRIMATWEAGPEIYRKRNRDIKNQVIKDIYGKGSSKYEKFTGKISRAFDRAYNVLEEGVGEPLVNDVINPIGQMFSDVYDYTLGSIFNLNTDVPYALSNNLDFNLNTDYDKLIKTERINNTLNKEYDESQTNKMMGVEGFTASLLSKEALHILSSATQTTKKDEDILSKGLKFLVNNNNNKDAQALLNDLKEKDKDKDNNKKEKTNTNWNTIFKDTKDRQVFADAFKGISDMIGGLSQSDINNNTENYKKVYTSLKENLEANRERSIFAIENKQKAQAYIDGARGGNDYVFYDTSASKNPVLAARKAIADKGKMDTPQTIEAFSRMINENEDFSKLVNKAVEFTKFPEKYEDDPDLKRAVVIGHLYRYSTSDAIYNTKNNDKIKKLKEQEKSLPSAKDVFDSEKAQGRVNAYNEALIENEVQPTIISEDGVIVDNNYNPVKFTDKIKRAVRTSTLSDRDFEEYIVSADKRSLGQVIGEITPNKYLSRENDKIVDMIGKTVGQTTRKMTGSFASKFGNILGDVNDLETILNPENKQSAEFLETPEAKKIYDTLPKNLSKTERQQKVLTLGAAAYNSNKMYTTKSGDKTNFKRIGETSLTSYDEDEGVRIMNEYKAGEEKNFDRVWDAINTSVFKDSDLENAIDAVSGRGKVDKKAVVSDLAAARVAAINKLNKEEKYQKTKFSDEKRKDKLIQYTIDRLTQSRSIGSSFTPTESRDPVNKLVKSLYSDKTVLEAVDDFAMDEAYNKETNISKRENAETYNLIRQGLAPEKAKKLAKEKVQKNIDLIKNEELIKAIDSNEKAAEFSESLGKTRGTRLEAYRETHTKIRTDALGNKTQVFDENTVMQEIAVNLGDLVKLMRAQIEGNK